MPDTVSAVIPAYRAQGTIRRAVDSVLAQTHAVAEVIVVDDGSPEPLAPALAGYGGRVRLLRTANGGVSSARNVGIDSSTGEFVAFLDADDHWEPDKVERQLALYRRFPDLGLTFGAYWLAEPGDGPDRPRRKVGLPLDYPASRPFRVTGAEAFAVAMRVWTGTVMVPRHALGENRFVVGLETGEDRDLWYRLVERAPVAFLAEPIATSVRSPGSLSRSDIDKDYGNMLHVVRRHAKSLGPRATREWEAQVFARWASVWLGVGRPAAAIRPAVRRLRLQWGAPQAWRIVASSLLRAAVAALRSRR